MLRLTRGTLVGIAVVLLTSQLDAGEPTSTRIVAVSQSKMLRIITEREGENQFAVFLERSNLTQREKIWGSFWGIIDAKFSSDERYVAIRDHMRFDVLSPVLVFRLEATGASLIYETPGNFSAEETRFTYEIGGFASERITIRVLSLERDHTSRASSHFRFDYTVDNLDKRKRVRSFFYTNSERGRLLNGIPETTEAK